MMIDQKCVSIAFRRSALRPHAATWWRGLTPGEGLHCLSAFCPSATQLLEQDSTFASNMSPLPFGVLPFGHETLARHIEVARSFVSIAFRRSALRPRGRHGEEGGDL